MERLFIGFLITNVFYKVTRRKCGIAQTREVAVKKWSRVSEKEQMDRWKGEKLFKPAKERKDREC